MNTKKNHSFIGVWFLVALLILLILLSFILLTSILRSLAAGDHNIIALTPEEEPTGFFSSLFYRRAPEAPELNASDSHSRWDVVTQVDLFAINYLDPSGTFITVESADDAKVIAPGTTNDYTFSLKNTGNIALDYTLSMESVFTLADEDLPFQVRLKRGNDWVLGAEESWATVPELNAVVDEGNLEVGNYVRYTLQWQWPFESDQDDMRLLQNLQDTFLGNASVDMDVNFQLTIKVASQIAPGAVPKDANGNLLYEELINPARLALAMLCLASGLLLLLLLLYIRSCIYVTGFVPALAGQTIQWKRQSDTIRLDGRFLFPRVPMGEHSFTVQSPEGTQLGELRWKLKRDRDIEGLRFETEDGMTTLFVGKGIIAVELHLLAAGPVLEIQNIRWAAIDRDHNVYSPLGKRAPDENKRNRTPDGLRVDENGKLEIEETVRV